MVAHQHRPDLPRQALAPLANYTRHFHEIPVPSLFHSTPAFPVPALPTPTCRACLEHSAPRQTTLSLSSPRHACLDFSRPRHPFPCSASPCLPCLSEPVRPRLASPAVPHQSQPLLPAPHQPCLPFLSTPLSAMLCRASRSLGRLCVTAILSQPASAQIPTAPAPRPRADYSLQLSSSAPSRPCPLSPRQCP